MRRFALITPIPELAELFSAKPADRLESRFKRGRDLTAPCVVLAVHEVEGHRELDSFWWSYVPTGARHVRVIREARGEDVAQRRIFADALSDHRILFIADWFYLWQRRTPTKLVGYLFRNTEPVPLALAAVCNVWVDEAENQLLRSCALITMPATEEVQPVAERMPVVLEPHEYDEWLDPDVHDTELLAGIIDPTHAPTLRRSRIKGSTMRRM
ncbi:MAG TPA: SOS response-associated peptidase family protein [Acidimicrobiales bacterium]|nr:SOS response-associated peptidase family protein [Acidimicrobiales bacterium]